MKLKQITIEIENTPGKLYEITQKLGEAGINLRALSIFETEAFGRLRILVSNINTARALVMEMQSVAYEEEVVAVEIADRPGELANILKLLLDGGINVTYMYAYVGCHKGKAVMIFSFDKIDAAITLLTEKGIQLLDTTAFETLDHS